MKTCGNMLLQRNKLGSVRPPKRCRSDMDTTSASDIVIIHGNSHPDLANLVAERMGIKSGGCSVFHKTNRETMVEIGDSVRGKDIYIIQTGTKDANNNIMELLIMAYACKTSSARSIVGVIPYLPYSKQCKMRKRGCIVSKLLAKMMCTSGLTHIITMDLHQKEIQGFFDIPVDNLRASPFLLQYIQESIPDYRNSVIVARNPGSTQKATSYAERLVLLCLRNIYFKALFSMLFRNSLSLPHHLLLRELNIYPGIRHPVPSHFLYHEKNIYKSVTPRMTIINVETPDICIRKFTPNGDQLIAFSEEQTTLEVYYFQGVQSAAFLVYHDEEECVSDRDDSFLSAQFRERLFEVMFSLEHHIHVVTTISPIAKEFLNREFSLFLDNGRYVLLASTTGGSIFPSYLAYQDYMDLYDDTELYDYTFYLVDLKKGIVADTYKLEHDFIVLSHNHSVSLYDHTLAIFSTYRQCIEIVDANFRDGKLKHITTIGPYGSEFDRDRVLAHQRNVKFKFNPKEKMPLSHLKQKILAYMYREIMNLNCLNERYKKLKEFYKNYTQVERMIISKMQLYDSHHLLLRYEKRQTPSPLDVGGINMDQTNKNFKLFVFYKIYEQEVVKIFTQDSLELVQIVRNHCDDFRNVRSLQIPWQSSSPSNNEYFRASFDEAFKNFSGGVEAATARFNSTLPISSQSFSTSPYLDFSIFKYDDRYISALERPRIKNLEGLEFFDRETENLLYRAHLEQQYDLETPGFDIIRNPRDLVSFIFHPFEPFFISVQKFTSHYVINFHIHNAYTKVEYYSDDITVEDYSSDENDNDEIINISGE